MRAWIALLLLITTAVGCGDDGASADTQRTTAPPTISESPTTTDVEAADSTSATSAVATTALLVPSPDCGLTASGTYAPVWNSEPAAFVDFADHPYSMRFWAAAGEASYYTADGIGFGNEWAETEEGPGIFEVAYDRDSFFWIDSSHPARVTVRYRGALKDETSSTIAHDDVESGSPWGPGDWAEETWRIYPDGTTARTVTIYTGHANDAVAFWGRNGVIFETQETFIYTEEPETTIEAEPLTLVKMDGSFERIAFQPYPPEVSLFPGANIQLVNLVGGPYPFTMVPEGEIQISAYGVPPTPPARFVGWLHEDLDGDGAADNYRVALSHVIPWNWFAQTDNTLQQVYLIGMIEEQDEADRVERAVTTARSWLKAPPLTIDTGELTSSGYSLTERAYVLEAISMPERVAITVAGTPDQPVFNPGFVVRGAGAARSLSLDVDGSEYADYCFGSEGDDLVIWVEIESDKPVSFGFDFGA